MDNFQLYKLLNFVINKDVYAQAIKPDEFDLELKAKNLRHFRKRLGLPETYIPSTANEGAGVTRLTDRDLLPFLVEETRNPKNGIVSLMANWYYINDWFTDISITSDLISLEEISNRLRNYITRPTEKHPCAYIIPEGLKVFPVTIKDVTVNYYRTPRTPVFNTIIDEDTLILEYDVGNSVELEWDDASKFDVLYMILQDMGVNVERWDLQQIASKLISQGK